MRGAIRLAFAIGLALARPAWAGDKAAQSIEFGPLPSRIHLDPDFTVEASASSGLPVVFIASGGCEMNESYVRVLAAGTCSLTAHQPGDSNFTAARIVDRWFPIAKAEQAISFADLPRAYSDTTPLLLSAKASCGLPIGFAAAGACQVSGSILYIVGEGTCTVTATQLGNGNFNAAPAVTQTLEVVGP